MHVLIIQPPDAQRPIQGYSLKPRLSEVFSPPWDLLCLQAFLLKNTRHTGHLLDCRLYSALERELSHAIESIPAPRVAAVNTNSTELGQASAVMEIISRSFPDTTILSFGQHPSQFPDQALLPRTHYALSGDPEPILRNFLDYMDLDQRLRRIPGLIFRDQDPGPPYWMDSLRTLILPDWETVYWRGYFGDGAGSGPQAAIRLSRGHPRTPADRAVGGVAEPLRVLPYQKVAASIQRCSGPGITEVFVEDPPGFWTLERLQEWCGALAKERSLQNWSLQLLPAVIHEDLAQMLSESHCRTVHFVFPSCSPEVLARYDCSVTPADLANSLTILRQAGVRSHVTFWVGGPEESAGEDSRILKAIRILGYCPFSLRPFPLRLDAPIYSELREEFPAPSLEEWVEWSRDPWLEKRPVALWGGEEAVAPTARTITRIQFAVQRSPRRLLRRLAMAARSTNWIATLEGRAAALLVSPKTNNP